MNKISILGSLLLLSISHLSFGSEALQVKGAKAVYLAHALVASDALAKQSMNRTRYYVSQVRCETFGNAYYDLTYGNGENSRCSFFQYFVGEDPRKVEVRGEFALALLDALTDAGIHEKFEIDYSSLSASSIKCEVYQTTDYRYKTECSVTR